MIGARVRSPARVGAGFRWLATRALACLCLGCADRSLADDGRWGLSLSPWAGAVPQTVAGATHPRQLPHSTVARSDGAVASAWLAEPTDRYAHGVLGDRLEASRLVLRTREAAQFHLDLPPRRVFEDLLPRLVDLDGDGSEEVLVVESDAREGASLAVYGLTRRGLTLRARSPFIGAAHRWLNPLGAGDFDGDGRLDLALVRTPHIGGVLEIYRYAEPWLQRVASRPGFSTHVIGSTELGLGRVVTRRPRDLLLLPDQNRASLVLLGWEGGGLAELARASIGAPVANSLQPAGDGAYVFRSEDGRAWCLVVRPPADPSAGEGCTAPQR